MLPFLSGVFGRLHEQRPVVTFLDPFAGSGAVARLAKWLGFAVHANDWEYYACLLNEASVAIDSRHAEELFAADGGLEAVIGELNALHGPPPVAYISRHYAPRQTATADYRRERLFYTRENAEFIDRVRCEIEDRYPPDDCDPRRRGQRALLLAALLYQAATHANTSGVFKACHKGFGGHGADALHRILSPMRLQIPQLIDGRRACRVTMHDAAECRASYDLIYLDPPYNQHQYGSNYFLLNSVARWDRPPVDERRAPDGSLMARAGIRPDWVQTRSAYCSRRHATAEFERLLEALDAPRLVLSYNAQGTVGLEELTDIVSRHGRLEIDATDYVRYRGGRQSLTRRSGNHEFVLIVHRDERTHAAVDISDFVVRRTIAELCGRAFAPQRLRDVAELEERSVSPAPTAVDAPLVAMRGVCCAARFRLNGRIALLNFDALYRLLAEGLQEQLVDWDTPALRGLLERLQAAVCADHAEEASLLLDFLSPGGLLPQSAEVCSRARERRFAIRRLLLCLRKLAHPKYRARFEALCRRVRRAAGVHADCFPGVLPQLDALEALARRRFIG